MNSRELKLGDQWLGDSHPCFVTFEAGPTHNGLESAKRLVIEAAKAGANAVKFQIFDADKLVENKEQLFEYSVLVNRETNEIKEVSEPLYEILRRRQLTRDEWCEVKQLADQLGLAFFATVGFEEDLELLIELNVHSIKIASADVNHYPLLRVAAKSGMNIQLDTGNAEIGEIKETIEFLESIGCSSIIIHQCPSGYPARLPSICLRMISSLRNEFPKYPIAYSDHTPDADMDIAAIALGANLVEKTITMDRCTESVEHIFSLEPEEMGRFITRLRDVEVGLGKPYRMLTKEQKHSRNKLRRGAYLRRDVQAGEKLQLIDIDFRRPCEGIPPNEIDRLNSADAVYTAALKKGKQILSGDVKENNGK